MQQELDVARVTAGCHLRLDGDHARRRIQRDVQYLMNAVLCRCGARQQAGAQRNSPEPEWSSHVLEAQLKSSNATALRAKSAAPAHACSHAIRPLADQRYGGCPIAW